MKTFLRKLTFSFLAMLCGWIACIIVGWIGYGVVMVAQGERLIGSYRLDATLIFAAATLAWALIIWLVIFLPVDLIIADDSKLRRPGRAALVGFASGFLFVVCYLAFVIPFLALVWDESAWLVFGVFGGGAAVTGCVAAFARSFMCPHESNH